MDRSQREHTTMAIEGPRQDPGNTKPLSTVAGAPVWENQNSLTAGARGPMLLQDVWFLEKRLSCCFRGLLSGASAGAPRPLLTFPDVDLVT
jgi:hypothetical protein